MIHKTMRSILSVLLAALLLVTSIPLTPAFAGGGGVSLQSESGEGRVLEKDGDGTYLIYTAENLKEFAAIVNGTDDNSADPGANARLMNDIDLKDVCGENVGESGQSVSWTPIGNEDHRYTGTFDGANYTISGLYINNSRADYQGLFGYVSGSGTVQNLSVSGTVSGGMYVGGVVGLNSGSVEDCDFTGSVSGSDHVGGVVGDNYPGASVKNCYNTGSVSGPDSGSGNSVGGVVGYNGSGIVENCYNIGKVTGSADSSNVGGVVGQNRGSSSVTNCYNTGEVSGNRSVGGVVGDNRGSISASASASVTNCYNTGKVTGSSSVGGVVGYNSGPQTMSSGTVTGCYFLKQNPEIPGIGNDHSATGATVVSDLTNQNEFKGWDFDNTWRISTDKKHPVLQANAEDNALSGTGTQEDPYKIYRAIDLKNFRDLVNDEGGQAANPNAHAKLMNDIDLNGNEKNQWTPIGIISQQYSGTFNGNGKTISGLYIKNTSSDTDYQGLFGFVGSEGTVQNLTVDGTVSVSWSVGGVVGYNSSGTVTNCAFSGSVSGRYYVGGVVGRNSGTYGSVTNCYNTGEVTGSTSGGVVGYNQSGTVENCYNTGTVSGSDYVGGVVGSNSGNVTNCYNTDSITVTGSGGRVGGVVGYNRGTVTNCYNTGNVSGGSKGGVVGYNSGGSVTNCYFLQGTAESDIGENEGSGDATATEKDDTAFHSGEVAWRLQDGQADGSSQVWGQNIKDGENDNYPQLRAFDADTPQVYKVAFMNDSEEHDAKYANSGMTVTIPAAPSREGHTFTGWSDGTSTYQAGAKVEITSDTKFTAQWTKDTVNYTVTVTASPAEGGTVNGGGTFAEGTQVTVTATANDGYTFVAWQEGGTKIENAGASYTFTVNGNRSLTAVFEKDEDPEPTPTPTPDPKPSGPSTGDSTGWDDIRDELENAENGDQITIDMGDETKVPAEIFESLAGKDVDVTFDLGDIQWSVNGADIPTDTDFTDLDLGVNLDTHGIPVNVINTITGEVGTVQITLAHDGEFGFTMTLTAPLGKENAGYWANLYHYDEDAEALNFEAAAKIDEDGSVTIPFSHASQYAIVIDTHSHATVDVSDLFIDIAPDAWYKDAVQYAYDNGLMTGVSATEFAPEATTTRAMIVSILARLEGVESAQAAGFADVDDEWYATAVNWAANVGVVNGYEDNTFRPNQPITREQLAAILMNYAAYKGEDVSNRADLTSYTDQPSTWAQEAMQWAVAEGLISGVTADTLQPQGAATRAQVAAILQRFLSE